MTMTIFQAVITIAMCVLGTVIPRFTPFLVFSSGKKTPKYIEYLGDVLPSAIFGMLVVYCLRSVNIMTGCHGIPELIACAVVVLLHLWKGNMFVSMLGGTAVYMALVQTMFQS